MRRNRWLTRKMNFKTSRNGRTKWGNLACYKSNGYFALDGANCPVQSIRMSASFITVRRRGAEAQRLQIVYISLEPIFNKGNIEINEKA